MLDLKRFKEGVWVDYEAGVRVLIKPLSKYDLVHIRSKCKRKIMVDGADGTQIVDDVDNGVFSAEVLKTCVLDTEGISVAGLKKPDREDLIVAIYQNDRLRDFILGKAAEIFEAENAVLEQELKNSESSHSGQWSSSS
jgi:predicted HTH domain antitoxin